MQTFMTMLEGTSYCDRCGKKTEDLTNVSIKTKVGKTYYKFNVMVLCRKCLYEREMIHREADVLLCGLYKKHNFIPQNKNDINVKYLRRK